MNNEIEVQNNKVIQVTNMKAKATIAPQFGARLMSWTLDNEPIIYWPENANWQEISKVRGGNPILFPFIGRNFADGTIYKWKSESGTVYPAPMHGFARDSVFDMHPTIDPHAIHMSMRDSEQTRSIYPFQFKFEIIYRLQPQSLDTSIIVSNTGKTPMPYYAGHHFYFAIPHSERGEWFLSLPKGKTVRQDLDLGSISFGAPIRGAVPLDDKTLSNRMHLVEAHDDFIVLANIKKSAKRAIYLNSPTKWFAVTTWTADETSDFYCVEPWLGLPNAVTHKTGIRMLAPGRSEQSTCRIAVE